MARKEGYWLDAMRSEVIPIYDHYEYLQELEAKVRGELEVSPEDGERAVSLGLHPGRGWGNVARETPAARKVRFMTEAMKSGWVRIRAHSTLPRITAEFWRKTDQVLAELAFALKGLGVSPGTELELHEVMTDSPSVVKAGALYARLEGEASPEEEAAVGFSVYSNPGRKRVRANGRERGSRRTFDANAPSAGGGFVTASTGRWNPLESPVIFGRFVRMNPYEQQKYVEPREGEGETVARLFLGLKVGKGEKARKIDPERVYKFIRDFRKGQLGGEAPGGASFIAQKGFFTHWEDHPASVVDEDSLQIIIYPDGRAGEDGAEFDGNYKVKARTFSNNMHALAPALAEEFSQKAVILSLIVNGKLDYLGDYHKV